MTDNVATSYFQTQKKLTPKQAWWQDFLVKFDFRLEYKPGKGNVVTDALSWKVKLDVIPTAMISESNRKIKEILAERKTQGRGIPSYNEYLIAWEGLLESEAGWEKEDTLWKFQNEIRRFKESATGTLWNRVGEGVTPQKWPKFFFAKLKLPSIAQGEPNKSQAVQRPKEEEQVHAKPMTRQCAWDSHARKGGRQTGRRARQMGARGKDACARQLDARAGRPRRPARAPDDPRWPQTPAEASRQCHEHSRIFQIVFPTL